MDIGDFTMLHKINTITLTLFLCFACLSDSINALALTTSNTAIEKAITKADKITKIDTDSCKCYDEKDIIACPICGCTATDPSMIGMCTIGKKPGAPSLDQNQVDSLVGNLVLSKALQNDKLLAKYLKKAGYGSTAMLGGILGISGVSMSSAIVGINTLNRPIDSPVPSTLAIISGGLTLTTFGLYVAYRSYYNKKIAKRQDFITNKVNELLTCVEQHGFTDRFKTEMTELIGPTAYKEFTKLWLVSHDPDLETYIKKISKSTSNDSSTDSVSSQAHESADKSQNSVSKVSKYAKVLNEE